MTALALALALASANAPPAPVPSPVGRIYTSSSLHLGLRGAVLVTPDEVALGMTFQLTAKVL